MGKRRSAVGRGSTFAYGGTQGTERVLDVLVALTNGPAYVRVSTLARELGLSKSVVHRILQSLVARGFVLAEPEQGGYRIGPAAAALGARALSDCDLRSAAMPVLRELQARTMETTTVSSLVGTEWVYLDQVVSLQNIRMSVPLGRFVPLYAGATGKAMLAVDEALCELVLSGPVRPMTERTVIDADALRRELQEASRTGYSTSRGERERGAACIASAVYGIDGKVMGAITICGPESRIDDVFCALEGPVLRDAAARISSAIRHGRA